MRLGETEIAADGAGRPHPGIGNDPFQRGEPGRMPLHVRVPGDLAMGGERETLNLTVQKAGGPGAPGAPVAHADPGPFANAPAQPAAAAAAAPVPALGTPPVTVPPASARGVPPATANQVPSPQATGQPMTPEELLARRRARRNQPTQ